MIAHRTNTSAQIPRNGHKAASLSLTRTYPSDEAVSFMYLLVPSQVKYPRSESLAMFMTSLAFSTPSCFSSLYLSASLNSIDLNWSDVSFSFPKIKLRFCWQFEVWGLNFRAKLTEEPFDLWFWSFDNARKLELLVLNNISVSGNFHNDAGWNSILRSIRCSALEILINLPTTLTSTTSSLPTEQAYFPASCSVVLSMVNLFSFGVIV